MTKPSITLIANDFGYIGPLACGDVQAEGIDLILDRVSPIGRIKTDASVDGGEISFSSYLIGLAQGNRSFVGLPVFPYWAFRQRCFYVRRNSPLKDLKDLVGKRVGTNAWSDSGNTWTRATLREAGIGIDQIAWWVGPVEDPAYDSWGGRPKITVPPYVHSPEPGSTLMEMLLEGEIDALMYPLAPKLFYKGNSPIVRLLENYVQVEEAYYRRTGIYPGHHLIGLKREVFDRDPWIARSLFNALDQSKALWQERRKRFAESTPWMLADIEAAMNLMGEDWMPNGVEPNRKMIQAFCEEQYAQKLIDQPLDPTTVFAEFEEVMSE